MSCPDPGSGTRARAAFSAWTMPTSLPAWRRSARRIHPDDHGAIRAGACVACRPTEQHLRAGISHRAARPARCAGARSRRSRAFDAAGKLVRLQRRHHRHHRTQGSGRAGRRCWRAKSITAPRTPWPWCRPSSAWRKRENIDDYIKAVEGRIGALAQTHELLSQSRWEGADILRLVLDEMAPYHSDGAPARHGDRARAGAGARAGAAGGHGGA